MSLTIPPEPVTTPTDSNPLPEEPSLAWRTMAGLRQFLPRWSAKLITGLIITGTIVLFAVVAPFFVQDPLAVNSVGLTPPSSEHILGTTQTGQDVFSQLAWGARSSLMVGLIAGVISTVLAAFFGIVGAYYGGAADNSFSLITNVALVIPALPLIVIIASYLRGGGLLVTAIVLGLTAWAGGARVLRGQVLSIRNRDYVLAARVAGERTWRILAVEILPNLLPVMASGFVFGVIFAILGEAGLAFLGLGDATTVTWGSMLYYAQNAYAIRLGAWWWFLPPGIMIALVGAGLSFINFAIDEVINPRLRTMVVPKRGHRAKAVVR